MTFGQVRRIIIDTAAERVGQVGPPSSCRYCRERARGVNRTSDDQRVDVLLLPNVPIPMPVDELLTTPELAPRVGDWRRCV